MKDLPIIVLTNSLVSLKIEISILERRREKRRRNRERERWMMWCTRWVRTCSNRKPARSSLPSATKSTWVFISIGKYFIAMHEVLIYWFIDIVIYGMFHKEKEEKLLMLYMCTVWLSRYMVVCNFNASLRIWYWRSIAWSNCGQKNCSWFYGVTL